MELMILIFIFILGLCMLGIITYGVIKAIENDSWFVCGLIIIFGIELTFEIIRTMINYFVK